MRRLAEDNPAGVKVYWSGHTWTLGGRIGFDSFDQMLAWVIERREVEKANCERRKVENGPYYSPTWPIWRIQAVPVGTGKPSEDEG